MLKKGANKDNSTSQNVRNTFRDRFRLIAEGYTQKKFGELIGVARQTVASYITGANIPDAEILYRIADKCGVSSDWLIGLSEVRQVDPDLNMICEYTGLSEKNVITLKRINEGLFDWSFGGIEVGKLYEFNHIFERCIENDFFSALFDVLYEFEKVKEKLDVKPTEGSSRRDYKKGAELISLDDYDHLMDDDWALALFKFQRACTRLIAEEDNELRELYSALRNEAQAAYREYLELEAKGMTVSEYWELEVKGGEENAKA